MFKRIKALFTLESRVDAAVSSHIEKIESYIKALEESVKKKDDDLAKTINRVKADMTARMSKIEVLFADELEAKEKERDQKVREARARALGNG